MHSLDFMVFSSLDIYVLTVTVGRAVILIRGVDCLMFKIISFSKKTERNSNYLYSSFKTQNSTPKTRFNDFCGQTPFGP